MKILTRFSFLILLCTLGAAAQGTHFETAASAALTVGSSPPGTFPPVLAISNAKIVLCNYPANASPCTNFATTYSDGSLYTPCASTQQLSYAGSSCQALSNAQGDWGFWAAAGSHFQFFIIVRGVPFGPYDVYAPGSGGGGGGGTGNYVLKTGDTMTGPLKIQNTAPQTNLLLQGTGAAPTLGFNRTDIGTDLKQWTESPDSSGTLHVSAVNDAGTTTNDAITCTRTAGTPTGCAFPGGITDTAGNTGAVNTIPIAQGGGAFKWLPASSSGSMLYLGGWSSGNSYTVGNVVTYSGAVYMCTVNVGSLAIPHLAQVNIGGATASGTQTATFSSNVVAGDSLVVFVGGAASTPGIIDTLGTTYSVKGSLTGYSNQVWMFGGTAPTGGADTVTLSGLAISNSIIIMEYSNLPLLVNATGSFFNASSNSNASNTTSVSVTTTAPTYIIGGQTTNHNNNAPIIVATGSPFGVIYSGNTGASIGTFYFSGNSGTYTLTTQLTAGGSFSNDSTPLLLVAFATAAQPPNVDSAHWIVL